MSDSKNPINPRPADTMASRKFEPAPVHDGMQHVTKDGDLVKGISPTQALADVETNPLAAPPSPKSLPGAPAPAHPAMKGAAEHNANAAGEANKVFEASTLRAKR